MTRSMTIPYVTKASYNRGLVQSNKGPLKTTLNRDHFLPGEAECDISTALQRHTLLVCTQISFVAILGLSLFTWETGDLPLRSSLNLWLWVHGSSAGTTESTLY